MREGRARALVIIAAALAALAATSQSVLADPLDSLVTNDLQYAGQELGQADSAAPVSSYPSQTPSPSGQWTTTDASAWTSGFFPGSLWLMYQATGDPTWRSRAEARQAGIASQQYNTSTHDLGFMIFNSFGNGYRLTGDPSYRSVVVQAATSLATRYNSTVGAFRSWDNASWNATSGASSDPSYYFKVIVDNMMNLSLPFWGAQNGGDPAWTGMAVNHALMTRQNHVRADGSTFHIVTYNSNDGSVISRTTLQGYSDNSTWARGQAWALYGFTQAYSYTNDSRFLDTARQTADYFIAHLPPDSVPYYDFQAPLTDRPKDSSAAAIAASGLLGLAQVESDGCRAQKYLSTAKNILTSLSAAPYLSQATPGAASILLHGTADHQSGNSDTGLIYGDYYFVEALLRYRALASGTTVLTAPTCVSPPVLSVVPTSLSFSGTQGGANPPTQTANVSNAGYGSLAYTATANAPWLTVQPSSGSAPAALSIGTNLAGVSPGTYTGTVTVAGGTVSGSPQSILVTLTVATAPRVLVGDAKVEATQDSNRSGVAEAFRTSAAASGNLAHISVYVDAANQATKLTVGVYADSSNHPGRLLTQGALASLRAGAWNSVAVPIASVTGNSTYWLALVGPVGSGTLQFRDRSGAGRSETSRQTTLTRLPTTWSSGNAYPDGPLSAIGGP